MILIENQKSIIPKFLKKDFVFSYFKTVNIDKIRVGRSDLNAQNIKYTHIKDTPHYHFVCQYLGLKVNYENKEISYEQYISLNPKENRSCQKFQMLIDSIITNGYQFEDIPILVFRSFRRPLPYGRLDVLDGFHRLAVLAALNTNTIDVAVLKRKQNICSRIINKING